MEYWEGKSIAEHRPVFYRDWRSLAVILIDGVRRSKKPTGREPARRARPCAFVQANDGVLIRSVVRQSANFTSLTAS